MNMNSTMSIFENINALVGSNSVFHKSIDAFNLKSDVNQSTFIDLKSKLSECTTQRDELLTSTNDYLSPLILFLFEHIPLEIDLNLLTSTQTDYHQILSSSVKIYKPNILPCNQNLIQYLSESKAIFNDLFIILQIKNTEELLILKQNTQPIYVHCLQRLKPFLLKTSYDKHPMAVHVFVHIIKSMRQSSLSEIIDFVFPVILMMLDDPSSDMKLISLYLLEHLQTNSTSTDLCLFNRVNVIMHSLEQNLCHRGDRMILFECLLATTYRWLIITENEIYSGRHLFTHTSQLTERFIRDALLETSVEYRRLLIMILRYYVNRLGLFSVRHLKRFIELIDDSIENRMLRHGSLKLLLTIIQVLKPRIDSHRCDMMKIVIHCLFKIIHEEKDNKTIMILLQKCAKELHRSTTENYVPDALRTLIEATELDLFYREHFQNLLKSIEEN